ncbi:HD family phosphohydrolase [Pseudofulvibacter geojedonensis]|uniref:HD family phosphohydrolase n=1 Tax=Pseudofulvibacter geojedonensis TaxID=1123758 RepID=A0ABW3HZ70_9FLAO
MKKITHYLYTYQSSIYKLLLFVVSVFFIVYLLPKGGSFKYQFEKGKVWQYKNLYAPFDFSIEKSKNQINEEEKQLEKQLPLYFVADTSIVKNVTLALLNEFEISFPDSLNLDLKNKSKNTLSNSLSVIYQKGLLSEDLTFSESREVIIQIKGSNKASKNLFGNFFTSESATEFLQKSISDSIFNEHRSYLNNLYFKHLKTNVRYNSNKTLQHYEAEKTKILPTQGLVKENTIIISKGEVVEGDKLQQLNSLKQIYTSQVWSESNYNWIVFGYSILVVLALLMLVLFVKKYRPSIFENNTKLTFIFFNIILMIAITSLMVRYQSSYLYIVPICIMPLILKAFFDARLGLFAHVITVLLLGFIVPNSYEYMFLQIIAGIITILTISELYKRANLFISVGQITLVYIIAYFSFYIIHEGNIIELKLETFGLFVLCGLATLFAQPLIYIFEKIFGLVSDVSLLELSDTNSKLLKDLADKAPGTFHHSLNVANLAEAAANEIGANVMLTRVGALYHDIGKLKEPTFFIENQNNNMNPHDEISPKESAQIIIDHVISGIEIAKKNRLPDRIIDFIRTHHGTSLVYYFYSKEKEINENVDITKFQYPGPKPFSKETAILMMCDSVEAASKSIKNPDYTKISTFVEQIIEKQKSEGQFLNANITFKEIEQIKKILKQKLINIYHLRIEYPD